MLAYGSGRWGVSQKRKMIQKLFSLNFDFAPRKVIQDSLELWTPRCGFRIPGSGFRIPFQ